MRKLLTDALVRSAAPERAGRLEIVDLRCWVLEVGKEAAFERGEAPKVADEIPDRVVAA